MGNISAYAFISYTCLAAAIIFAVISVLLFIRFKIRKVFSFLTGRAQKMTIEKLEAENIEKGKAKAPSRRMTTSGRLKPSNDGLPDENESKEAPAGTGIQTEPPDGGPAETELLVNRDLQTVPLSAGMDETALLTSEREENFPEQPAEVSSAEKFVVIRSIVLIHTQERIQ